MRVDRTSKAPHDRPASFPETRRSLGNGGEEFTPTGAEAPGQDTELSL